MCTQPRNGTLVHSYVLTHKLGEGGSGVVFEGIHSVSQQVVAVKFFPVQHKNTFAKEAYYLEKLQGSQNIVHVVDHFVWEEFYVIVMEKLAIDLLDLIEQSEISINDGKKIFKQVCSGLKTLHDSNIAHRDIKPENIFLNSNDSVKLGDFGSAVTTDDNILSTNGIFGTSYYSAPEILQNEFYDPKSSDIWSLGIVLHIMFTGVWPFQVRDDSELLSSISNGSAEIFIFENLLPSDKNLVELIKAMLNSKPEKRPNIDEVLKSKFLRKSIIKRISSKEIERRPKEKSKRSLPKLINFIQSKLK